MYTASVNEHEGTKILVCMQVQHIITNSQY